MIMSQINVDPQSEHSFATRPPSLPTDVEYPYSPQPPTLPKLDPPAPWPTFEPKLPSLIWVLAATFGFVNLAILPLTEFFAPNRWGGFWIFVLVGGIPAQAGLLSLWLVFGDDSFARRALI